MQISTGAQRKVMKRFGGIILATMSTINCDGTIKSKGHSQDVEKHVESPTSASEKGYSNLEVSNLDRGTAGETALSLSEKEPLSKKQELFRAKSHLFNLIEDFAHENVEEHVERNRDQKYWTDRSPVPVDITQSKIREYPACHQPSIVNKEFCFNIGGGRQIDYWSHVLTKTTRGRVRIDLCTNSKFLVEDGAAAACKYYLLKYMDAADGLRAHNWPAER